jgi:glycosyltransferase involved in cell wall biosynthesis
MKLLVLTQYFPPEIGAAPTRLQNIVRELVRAGNGVEVVTGLPNYPLGRFFDGYEKTLYRKEVKDGVTIHRIWMLPALGGGLRRILNYLTFAAFSFWGLLRSRKPDFLFVESPPLILAVPGVLFSWIWSVPFILNIADLWPDAAIDMGFMKKDGLLAKLTYALERWSYRHASYVNAVTEGIRQSLLETKRVPPGKVLFLPNGVDTALFQTRGVDAGLKERLGLQGKRIILWAGTLGGAHGLEHVLDAADLLRSHPDIHFLFVGDGTVKPSLEEQSLRLLLTNVTFHPPVPFEQVPNFFSIAQAGLASLLPLPVHEGARPSKVFPVFASGKPLIFVGRGEAAQLVRDAKAGIVVPPGDPEALASAVVGLFTDPGLLEELGGNGRSYVEKHFQWSQLIAAWLERLHRGPSNQEAHRSVS